MENYKAIVEQVRAIEIKSTWDIRNEMSRELNAIKGDDKKAVINLRKEVAERYDAISKENDEKEVIKHILWHNAEVAYYTEFIGKVCEVYQKYAGKRVGDKTDAKIRDEIAAIVGNKYATFSLYPDKLYIDYPFNNHHDVIYFTYYKDDESGRLIANKKFNSDGKLNNITPEMFQYSKKYIDDIPAYIKRKTEQAETIRTLSAQLEGVIHDYNDDLVIGLHEADYGRTNTYMRIK